MAERLSDQTLDRVDLPISRYDIADYLGLSVETICRSLTSLKKHGLIALSGPLSVRIIDGGCVCVTRNTSGFAGVALIYQRIPLERRGQL
jgi:predicted transcriptional regulator